MCPLVLCFACVGHLPISAVRVRELGPWQAHGLLEPILQHV